MSTTVAAPRPDATPLHDRRARPSRSRGALCGAALFCLLAACAPAGDPIDGTRDADGHHRGGDASVRSVGDLAAAPMDAGRGPTDAGVPVDALVAGTLTITSPLTLDRADVSLGGTIAGHITYTNLGAAPVTVNTVVIAGRPPGGTHGGGPYDDFSPPAAPTVIQPGGSLTLDATRSFAAGDPTGTWESYGTWQDGAGGWHDGPSVYFTASTPMTSSSGNLPSKVVGGYFTTWDARNGVTLSSIVDNTNYNLVYVAFAVGVDASSGSLRLDLPPGAASAADFKSQIAYANTKGKKVIVSVGGYFDLGGSSSGYVLDSSTKVDQFMVSMHDLHDQWGFNGMDWDLEHGERPDVAGIVDASRRMRADFGSTWIINFAPGIDLASWVGAGGVLDALGPGGWDAVGEQVYDLGLSQTDYRSRIVSRMTALSSKYGADKVILGNKYRQDSPSAPYDPSGYVDIATTEQAFAQLRSAGVDIRGSFVWNIQSDSDQSFAWSSGVGADILSHP